MPADDPAAFLQDVTDERPPQWSQVCPRGHANVTAFGETYRCDSCEALYEGEPYSEDGDGPFPLPDAEEPVPETSWVSVLWAIKRHVDTPLRSEFTSARIADKLGARTQSVSNRMSELRERGYIEPVNEGSMRHRWQLTEAGEEGGGQ